MTAAHLPVWVYFVLFVVGMVLSAVVVPLLMPERQSSDVAKTARESGITPPWPAPPMHGRSDLEDLLRQASAHQSADPLHQMPSVIQPILFADGHRITPDEIHAQGLCFLVDDSGRIVSVMMLDAGKPAATWTVEDWCGVEHGARIS